MAARSLVAAAQARQWSGSVLGSVVPVHHVSYFRDAKPGSGVSLDRALAAVQESVRVAAEEASRRLRDLGSRHALIGGLAVGASGAPRNTTDVDFLVGLEAF